MSRKRLFRRGDHCLVSFILRPPERVVIEEDSFEGDVWTKCRFDADAGGFVVEQLTKAIRRDPDYVPPQETLFDA